MGEKCATSIECQTIRIAESSDMDNWKAVLRSMCKSFDKLKMKLMSFSYHCTKGSVPEWWI